MKTVAKTIGKAVVFCLVMMVLCSLIYPLVVKSMKKEI